MTVWKRIAFVVFVAVCVALVVTAGVYSSGNPWVTGVAELLAFVAIAQAAPQTSPQQRK